LLDKLALREILSAMTTRIQSFLFCLAALSLPFVARPAERSEPAIAKGQAPRSFQIRNEKYRNLLRPEDANSANGTPIVLYPAQPWKCMTWKLDPCGESECELQNHFTSKTFAAAAPEGKSPPAVSQVPFSKNPKERPKWKFTKLSNGGYRITDARTGKALTAIKEENGSRITVVVQAWHDGEDQKWELIEVDPNKLTM